MSGHIFFNDDWYGFDDAIYSALRMIEVLSKSKLTTYEVFNSYPKYFSTPEINLKVPEENKFKVIDELKTLVNSSVYTLIDIDGIRLENENSWGLVRASNTSPNLVLRFEGKTESDLLEIKNYFKEILSKIEFDFQLDF